MIPLLAAQRVHFIQYPQGHLLIQNFLHGFAETQFSASIRQIPVQADGTQMLQWSVILYESVLPF